jgi:predicted alpha-1,2-mannosidase
MYTDTGFWDTFRCLFPFLNLMFPSVNKEIQEGLINTYKESGFFPEWASPGHRDCMVGNNSASVLVDAYMKGVRVDDLETLYEGLVHGTESVHPKARSTGRLGYDYYNRLGYVPYDVKINESAARTLEYAYDDWCIYTIAKALNRPDKEIDLFAGRAMNYRNLFDKETLLMRGRNEDGTFASPFSPLKWGDAFTEGNSWHYTWSVFHDPQGLIDLMGGKEAFTGMLDSVFSVPPLFDDSYYGQVIHEIREMTVMNMGNYAHGNQPVQHMIYLYNYAGAPWKAQYWLRQVMDRMYTPGPDGYCGDEDNGQTSAWYVFSALGFYPVCPGTDEYVLGAPLFRKATLTFENGKTFVIDALDNGPETPYIQFLSLNGEESTKNYLKHADLHQGGTLNIVMSHLPNRNRGTEAGDLPYSFSTHEKAKKQKEPVDEVNPYMGNISHLLVPTYPTVHLPNSFLRIYPERADYTADRLNGLPLIVTGHRGRSAFKLSPFQGNENETPFVLPLSYDNEEVKPYRYSVYLDEAAIAVDYAPSRQSAVYNLSFERNEPPRLIFSCRQGALTAKGNTVTGYETISPKTKVYLYAETDAIPLKAGIVLEKGGVDWSAASVEAASHAALALAYSAVTGKLNVRYGISFISEEQAKRNLEREIAGYDASTVAEAGRKAWNEALNKICVEGGTENERAVFYTSLYRCYERPVELSEDGRYYSAFDDQVHDDGGRPFYTDDWIWDTYRAAHPLRILIDQPAENDIIRSFLLMAEQMGTNWMPTFPGIAGDGRAMNSNHGVAMVIDAYKKGLRGFDLEKAYQACKKAIEEKTLIPWSDAPAGWLDDFYREHGYIPALRPDEPETVPNVSSWEKRQPVAVTLGTAYDQWCLSLIARELGKEEEADYYLRCSGNYRNLFHPETRFFHPKDKEGKFIDSVDYRFSGGLGGRHYYDENNGYVYRWDVQHDIPGLIALMGGNEAFAEALDGMFVEPLGMSKWQFYALFPDHTGNVGQFSMANEPSLHIPYLYNYAGQPWKTQKRIRTLLDQWFRNDLMGVPGDEDGGGMSAFVVFSQMGFYPVTPGSPLYTIGSPQFSSVKIDLGNGRYFEIKAGNASAVNKYIQSAKLNGKPLDSAWFAHEDIANGGLLELEMGAKANKEWGKE